MLMAPAARLRFLFPLAVLVTAGGCFATRNDVRVVQTDVQSLRTELLRNDAELREALAQATRTLAIANDSLRALGMRAVSTQGDVRGGTRSISEQLLQIQSLLGQSQTTINRLRAEMEQRNTMQQMVPPVSVPPSGVTPPAGGTTVPPVPPTGGVRDSATASDSTAAANLEPALGPSQLYTQGVDNLRRNSYTTARTLFQELLSNYPTSDHAPNAQYYIGESYEREKNLQAADAAYSAVVTVYPNADRAPTALFKRAKIAQQLGNLADARRLADDVVTRYPRSDEAVLVPDFLRNLR